MSPAAPTCRQGWVLLAIAAFQLAGCGDSHHGSSAKQPPRPPANAASETLVQASGAQQADPSGLIANDAIVGEPIAAGTMSTTGATEVRHGFTPPRPPGWPSGIASNDPTH